nr:MAG TPA: hypothetical protein [Caudoviricetes sp.]
MKVLEEWLNHAGYRRCYICRHLIMVASNTKQGDT